MTQEEAIQIMELIKNLYPRYSISKEKGKMLIIALLPMDYEGIKENLTVYVAAHPYAPMIAEIAAHPVQSNNVLGQTAMWRDEANRVSLETRQAFQKEMKKLIGDKKYDKH